MGRASETRPLCYSNKWSAKQSLVFSLPIHWLSFASLRQPISAGIEFVPALLRDDDVLHGDGDGGGVPRVAVVSLAPVGARVRRRGVEDRQGVVGADDLGRKWIVTF